MGFKPSNRGFKQGIKVDSNRQTGIDTGTEHGGFKQAKKDLNWHIGLRKGNKGDSTRQ